MAAAAASDATSYRVRWVSREPPLPTTVERSEQRKRETWLVLAPSAVPLEGLLGGGGCGEAERDVVVAVRRPSSSPSPSPRSPSSFVASLFDDSCPLTLSEDAHARLLLDSVANAPSDSRCDRLLAVQPPQSPSSPSPGAFDLLWAFRAIALRARRPEAAASLPPMATVVFSSEGSEEGEQEDAPCASASAASAAAIALAKTLRMEARRAAGPAVVLPWPLSSFESTLLPALTGAWAAEESSLAVRPGGRVFAERLCAVPAAAPSSPCSLSASSPSLRNRTAVVFGGTRGLGLELAVSCARDRGASALVLASREPALRREELERLAALSSSSSVSSSSSSYPSSFPPLVVVIAKVDASDAFASARLLSWVREELPPLGVVGHAAGGISHDELSCLSEAQAAAVATPKLAAAELMMTMTTSAPISTTAAAAEHLCFSSTAAAWSQPGSGHYAAANAALAACAAAAAARGAAASAPRLGPFGGNQGMAAAHAASMRALGLSLMPAGNVARLLGEGVGREGGSPGPFAPADAPVRALFDRRRFREVNTARGGWAFLEDLDTMKVEEEEEKEEEEKEEEEKLESSSEASAAPVGLCRRRKAAALVAVPPPSASSSSSSSSSSSLPVPSLESVASTIASIAAHISGFPVPASGSLVGGSEEQVGLDSLGAVEFARGVTAALRLPAPPLPPTLAFDHPTVEAAARHVHALLVTRLGGVSCASSSSAVAEEGGEEDEEESEGGKEAIPLPPLPLSLLPCRRFRRSAAPLALIAVSARLPGPHPSTLDACSVVPHSRWDAEARRAHGPARALRHAHWFASGAGAGGAEDDFASFDGAAFGGVSPPEAEALDPQQRLLLQGAAEIINGLSFSCSSQLRKRDLAVFVGIQQMEYGGLAARSSPATVGAHSATGTSFSVSAGRVSFTFGLSGGGGHGVLFGAGRGAPGRAVCEGGSRRGGGGRRNRRLDLGLGLGVFLFFSFSSSVFDRRGSEPPPLRRDHGDRADGRDALRRCQVQVYGRGGRRVQEGRGLRRLAADDGCRGGGESGGGDGSFCSFFLVFFVSRSSRSSARPRRRDGS